MFPSKAELLARSIFLLASVRIPGRPDEMTPVTRSDGYTPAAEMFVLESSFECLNLSPADMAGASREGARRLALATELTALGELADRLVLSPGESVIDRFVHASALCQLAADWLAAAGVRERAESLRARAARFRAYAATYGDDNKADYEALVALLVLWGEVGQ